MEITIEVNDKEYTLNEWERLMTKMKELGKYETIKETKNDNCKMRQMRKTIRAI